MRLVYEPILPNGYTRLEYLEATGNQYIDTGYTITEEDNIDATYDIALTNISGRGLMGYSLTQVGYWGKTASNTYELGGGNTQVATGNRDIVRFKRDVISTTRQDTDLYINDVVVGHAQRSTTAEIGPFQIFACRGSFKMAGKLYGATLTINNEQIRKFIPALRNSDSEPGMYDTVTNTFYTNAGTGIFNYRISKEEDIVDNPRYQQVEYIESTGSQYIDTGYIPNQDTRVISEFEYTKDPGNTGFIFGAGYSATDRAFELYTWTNNWNSPYGNTNIIVGTSASLLTSGKIYADKNKNTILIKYSDGTEQTGQTDYTEFTVPNRNIWLFSINRGSTVFLADCVRLYSCKIYDDNKLIRNFIPVIRKIDNKPGMYDKITKQFYTNAGSGDDFLYGNKINQPLPKIYEKLEYLESTGTQYIDTGVRLSNTHSAELKLQTTGAWTEQSVFGARISASNNNFTIQIAQDTGASQFHSGNSVIVDFNNSNYITYRVSKAYVDGQDYTCYVSSTKRSVNESIQTTTCSDVFTNQTNAYLFSISGSPFTSRMFAGKIYYCKIWDSGVLVRDFRPALRKTDNKPGMYDFVSGQFFINQGTDADFTYETYPKLLSNSKLRIVKTGGYTIYDDLYKEVEYLQATGTQYIDTDFKPNNNTKIDLIGKFNTTYPACLWATRWSGSPDYDTYGAYAENNSAGMLYVYCGKYSGGNFTGVDNATFPHRDGNYIRFIQDRNTVDFTNLGTGANWTYTFNEETFQSTRNLALFYFSSPSAFATKGGYIKSCKIWDNGSLVRDFVPVIRMTDNEPGMYDKKNRVFYTNAGTGEFIYPTPTLTKPLVTRLIAGGYV